MRRTLKDGCVVNMVGKNGIPWGRKTARIRELAVEMEKRGNLKGSNMI